MSRRSTRLANIIVPLTTPIKAKQTKPATAVPTEESKIESTEKNKEKAKRTSSQSQEVTPIKKRKAAPLPAPVDDGKGRCFWAANPQYPLLQKYHDTEWCVPGGFNRTNRYLFEMIILEGAQAGLSWSTVLHKRDAYREAYDNFDYNVIADTYTSPSSNERLLQTNIVKNRLKVEASMINAKAFRDLLQELYPDQAQPEDENGFWQFLQAYKKPEKKKGKLDEEAILTTCEASDRLSADLRKRGFKFDPRSCIPTCKRLGSSWKELTI
ncbi:hypothetical protein BGZ49_004933 [Haplosporangium sp. Z 27]|nr:hypothetical protein BGZ49_004933 [Haplosporangium sp. Z 27]